MIKQPDQREVYLKVGDLIGVSEENKSNAADRAYISRVRVTSAMLSSTQAHQLNFAP